MRVPSTSGRQWMAIALIGIGAVVFAVALMTGLSRLLSRPAATEGS